MTELSINIASENLDSNAPKLNTTFVQVCKFIGEADNPLLAPRGVFFDKNVLTVSDTAQNRVFIWNNFEYNKTQKATVVLGQLENTNTERNAGNTVSASSLQYPSGLWTNGKILIVADAWNHRVLIWNNIPTTNGQAADVVIGQKDFESNQPNIGGIGKSPTAQTLYWPYGVWSNGKSLWIADTGNRRVLFFENIPTENYAAADKVIGQQTMNEKDYDGNNAVWPYSVKINTEGNLAITDTQYYRVLLWKNHKDAFTKNADTIIGQPTLQSNGQNQFYLKPKSNTLNWCYDCCFYKNGIAVADTGNSRILIWNEIPTDNNEHANTLIGQPNFSVNGESSLSFSTTVENEMYWPFAINSFEDNIIVADTGNHRVLFYKPVAL
jgi:hypothetical protein